MIVICFHCLVMFSNFTGREKSDRSKSAQDQLALIIKKLSSDNKVNGLCFKNMYLSKICIKCDSYVAFSFALAAFH